MNTRQTGGNATGNIFERLFQSYSNPRTVRVPPPINVPPSTNAMQIPQPNTLINAATINLLQETMAGYNTNFRAYNENIRIFLEIIEASQTNAQGVTNTDLSANMSARQEPREQPNVTPQPTANHLFNNMFSGIFQTQPIRNVNATLRTAYYTTSIPSNVSDTVIRPTTEQINNALENITYNVSEQNSSTCPITLEEFVEGDSIRRIKHCGHIFSIPAINSWFNRHVRCPVCRYDIREYITPNVLDIYANTIDNQEEQEQEQEDAGEQQPSDILVQAITNEITSLFENFANNMLVNPDSSNNFVYHFDIPVITTYEEDISDDLGVE